MLFSSREYFPKPHALGVLSAASEFFLTTLPHKAKGAGTAPHSANAPGLRSLFPTTFKLERRSKICALGHIVPESTVPSMRGAYGDPYRARKFEFPLPLCLARRTVS